MNVTSRLSVSTFEIIINTLETKNILGVELWKKLS